jgi:hypothetical protein
MHEAGSPAGISSFFLLRTGSPQFFQQGKKIAGYQFSIQWRRFYSEPDDQVARRKLRPLTAKLLANDTLDPVAVDCSFEQFFPDHHTKSGVIQPIRTWLVMQHQQFAPNRSPETKNG